MKIDNTLPKTGQINTQGVAMAGAPVVLGDGYLVALQNGDLIRTDSDGNEVGNGRLNVGQALHSGPIMVGNLMVVLGIDGSVLHLDPVLQGGE